MAERIGSVGGIARRWLGTYVLVCAALLVVGGVVGYLAGTFVTPEMLSDQAADSPFFPSEITFQSILVNNVVAVSVMLLGAVSLGTLTVFAMLFNGFLVGLVVQLALREATLLEVLLLIVPHGVIEIPAMLIVGAIGLRFGHRTYRYVRGREADLLTGREIKEAALLYGVALVLIVVAAWIEAEYTIQIAESITGTPLEPRQ